MNRRHFLAGGAVTTIGGTAGCLESIRTRSNLDATGEWPRPEFDRQATGNNRRVTGPRSEPDVRWDADAPVDDAHLPTVVVSDGTAFVSGGSTVTALEVADGSRRFQTRVGDDYSSERDGRWRRYHGSAAVDDEHVYVGNHEGLTALTRDGDVAWSHEVPARPGRSGVFRSPAVTDEAVYFCAAGSPRARDSETYALVAYTTDGEMRWEREFERPLLGAPAVSDETVFVLERNVGLHAIDTDGNLRWSVDTGTGGISGADLAPMVYRELVYVVGESEVDDVADTGGLGTLGAYDIESGEEVWSNTMTARISGSPALVSQGPLVLACPSLGGHVFMTRWDDGTVWSAAFAQDFPVERGSTPSTDEDSVYLAGGDSLTRIVDGRRAWKLPLEGLAGNVAILEGAIVAASTEGQCYGIA